MHFQRFGEALRGIQDKMAEKKFYLNNMNKCKQTENQCCKNNEDCCQE